MGNIGVILLLNCFFYILSSCIPIVGIKYVQYKYNYNNYWFNIFLTISLCPIYFLFLIRRDVRQRLYKYKKKLLLEKQQQFKTISKSNKNLYDIKDDYNRS